MANKNNGEGSWSPIAVPFLLLAVAFVAVLALYFWIVAQPNPSNNLPILANSTGMERCVATGTNSAMCFAENNTVVCDFVKVPRSTNYYVLKCGTMFRGG